MIYCYQISQQGWCLIGCAAAVSLPKGSIAAPTRTRLYYSWCAPRRWIWRGMTLVVNLWRVDLAIPCINEPTREADFKFFMLMRCTLKVDFCLVRSSNMSGWCTTLQTHQGMDSLCGHEVSCPDIVVWYWSLYAWCGCPYHWPNQECNGLYDWNWLCRHSSGFVAIGLCFRQYAAKLLNRYKMSQIRMELYAWFENWIS